MPPRYRLRRAVTADIPVLVRHRIEMFRSMVDLPGRKAAVIAAAFRRLLRRDLPRGGYLAWVAEREGEVVAGAGVVLRPVLPRPWAPRGGVEAHVLNVFTEPEHRRRGLARRLTREVLAWARREKVAVVTLHASDMGRPVYESLGFTQTREMQVLLSKGPRRARRLRGRRG